MPTKTERAYMPHIWIQKTGFGPKVWAGEIMFRGQALNPVRFAALTKPGFDELTKQLQADISRVRGVA